MIVIGEHQVSAKIRIVITVKSVEEELSESDAIETAWHMLHDLQYDAASFQFEGAHRTNYNEVQIEFVDVF